MRALGVEAKKVFGRMGTDRPDLRGNNWQMAHVVENAASRLRHFMASGKYPNRTFKSSGKNALIHRDSLSDQKRRNVDWHKYHLPHMDRKQFQRISNLPGMRKYLKKHGQAKKPPIPWYLFGEKDYAAHLGPEGDDSRHFGGFETHPKAPWKGNEVARNAQTAPQAGASRSLA